MQYLCLIYEVESEMLSRSEEEQNQIMADYWAFTNDVKDKGQLVAGEALLPTETATTVRVRDGKRVTTDGPFAETKEQLGGFYLLECKDLDEAIDQAARIPSAKYGSIEVRPVMVFEQ
ncbi:MAG: YciI family protein [Gammaproteobacteria bacterium]